MGVGSSVGQNHPGCQGVEPPGTSLPRSYPISLGQMRKHLRGPGQATYDFDGGQPGLLRVKKEGGPQAKLSFHMSAHKERILPKRRFMRGHPLLPRAAKESFGSRTMQKVSRGPCPRSPRESADSLSYESRRVRNLLNQRPYIKRLRPRGLGWL